MTGDAASTSSDGFVPAQNSMRKRIATKTMALPRSGCLSTSKQGKPAMIPGMIRSRSVAGGSRSVASQRASIRMVASLASSAGCPNRCPAIAIHDLLPAAVPAPVPMTSVSSSKNNVIAYTHGVAHSSMRGDVRNVIPPTMSPSPSHTTWCCHIVVTNVGTSVWPAEYSVASPYTDRAATDATRPLSSWRARDSTVGRDGGGNAIGQRANLERGRRGVRRQHHPDVGAHVLDAQVMRDRARHERRDVGSFAREFHNRANHDFRLVGRREADEPAVRGSMRVLRRAGLPGDRERGGVAGGGPRRASLD